MTSSLEGPCHLEASLLTPQLFWKGGVGADILGTRRGRPLSVVEAAGRGIPLHRQEGAGGACPFREPDLYLNFVEIWSLVTD